MSGIGTLRTGQELGHLELGSLELRHLELVRTGTLRTGQELGHLQLVKNWDTYNWSRTGTFTTGQELEQTRTHTMISSKSIQL